MIPYRHGNDGRLAVGMDDDAQTVGKREALIRNVHCRHEAGKRRGCGHGGRALGKRLRHRCQGERGQADEQGQSAGQGRKDHAAAF